jgi:DNA-binding beta-propeller fold protein YncE
VGGLLTVIVFTPDSKTAYVSGTRGVIPISTATNKAGAPIVLPSPTAALAITPDGKTVLAGGRETVTPISMATNTAERPIGGIHSGADALVIAP